MLAATTKLAPAQALAALVVAKDAVGEALTVTNALFEVAVPQVAPVAIRR
ncbi:MAG: hypothetical protein LBD91_04785 [Prevotellaceae bacterium]|nr:hypothetical protein [Prevotellaceae bacterium]